MEQTLDIAVLKEFPEEKRELVDRLLEAEIQKDGRKLVVLDDDPTGVQTVHGVSVYTDWSLESLRKGFLEEEKLFFILTNSRSFTKKQTEEVHEEIAERAALISKELGKDYLILSRGDSTLRGHYPLEPWVLKNVTQKLSGETIDGEIFCPYFREGGRYTIGNIHYVKSGDKLVPAGQTEFAKDKTFGYLSSDLRKYVEEKTEGAFTSENIISISIEELRSLNFDAVLKKLMEAQDFNKIIVNAMSDYDLKVFSISFYRAMKAGKRFMVRTAASMVKVMGGISEIHFLTKQQMFQGESHNGGIVIIGSYTAKTTEQMEELKKIPGLSFIEINTDLVLQDGALEAEAVRLAKACDVQIGAGKTVVVYTKRKLLAAEGDTKEAAFARSVRISEAVQSLVGSLCMTPAFVVAKGGITSSDVGMKALKVKRARVMGQIASGIPVWDTGEESRFPGIPYVIFPGNVGERQTLREVVGKLLG